MKLRKLNRITHRDLGYIFFGMTVIYSLSGIALNHLKDWNPSYIVNNNVVNTDFTVEQEITKNEVLDFLETLGEKEGYKKHYFPTNSSMKIFFDGGSAVVDLATGKARVEHLKRRPVFYQFNWLHYNHAKKLWTWFADIFAVALFVLAVTGLFMVKGKNGITRRGAWLTAIGVIIPAVLFVLYI